MEPKNIIIVGIIGVALVIGGIGGYKLNDKGDITFRDSTYMDRLGDYDYDNHILYRVPPEQSLNRTYDHSIEADGNEYWKPKGWAWVSAEKVTVVWEKKRTANDSMIEISKGLKQEFDIDVYGLQPTTIKAVAIPVKVLGKNIRPIQAKPAADEPIGEAEVGP